MVKSGTLNEPGVTEGSQGNNLSLVITGLEKTTERYGICLLNVESM